MLNVVCMNGRLVKDCTLEQVGKDSVKCRFTIAVNRDYKDKDGNYPCDFIDCEVWNAGAHFLEEWSRKGDLLSVSGSLRKDTWKDTNGDWQSRSYVSVSNVNILSKREPDEDEKPQTKKSSKRR